MRYRKWLINHLGGCSARLTAMLALLLAAQAGCIPHYNNFDGEKDGADKDQLADGGHIDERGGEAGLEIIPPDVSETDQHVCVNDICVCQPDCAGKECGDNGCGGSCGPCPEGKLCSGFVCVDGPCTHECSYDGQKQCQAGGYTECGYDYDGDSCLEWSEVISCPPGNVCDNGECVCVPDCVGKECGGDGCGGTCGTCQVPLSCAGGICIGCGDGECGFGEHKCNCPADCSGGCLGCCAGTDCKTGDALSFCGIAGIVCDECVGGEACQDGDCVCTPEHHQGCSGGKLYWYDSCDVQGSEIGDCDEPTTCTGDADCKDTNPCTIDYCAQDPGVPYKTCHYINPGGVQCCMSDSDCFDGNLCTTDGCSGNQCMHSNVGNDTPCGNKKSCQGGVCQYHCGDGLCGEVGGETCTNCPFDCGWCSQCNQAPDQYEPNDSLGTAFVFPGITDAQDDYMNVAATMHSDSDVDWYQIHVEDTLFNELSLVVSIEPFEDGEYELCVTYGCDEADTEYSLCQTADGPTSVSLDVFGCQSIFQGDNDSGTAWIRMGAMSQDLCFQYLLEIDA